jgi:hypothetical protein
VVAVHLASCTRGLSFVQTLVLAAVAVGGIAAMVAVAAAVRERSCAQTAAIGSIGEGGGGGCADSGSAAAGASPVARLMTASSAAPADGSQDALPPFKRGGFARRVIDDPTQRRSDNLEDRRGEGAPRWSPADVFASPMETVTALKQLWDYLATEDLTEEERTEVLRQMSEMSRMRSP